MLMLWIKSIIGDYVDDIGDDDDDDKDKNNNASATFADTKYIQTHRDRQVRASEQASVFFVCVCVYF